MNNIKATIHLSKESDLTCSWCGNTHKAPKSAKGHWDKELYRYGTDDDWRGISMQKELFCSIDCMRTYHNISKENYKL